MLREWQLLCVYEVAMPGTNALYRRDRWRGESQRLNYAPVDLSWYLEFKARLLSAGSEGRGAIS